MCLRLPRLQDVITSAKLAYEPGDFTMKIIDAQIHLWSKGTVVVPHRTEPYLLDEALGDMDDAGVHGAILHPPSWDPDSHRIAREAVEAQPERFAILGRIPPDEPARRGEIESWLEQPGMVGLRYTFLKPHMKSWLTDGTMDWLWPAAERLGIPVAMLVGDTLSVVDRIAEKHPDLRLIIDHFGVNRGHVDDEAFATLPQVTALARHPNVAVKATGGPQYVSDGYPFTSLTPRYKALYDAFGPRRMFWGTDITRMPCSWRECVTAFTEHQTWMPDEDMAWVMGRGVCAWLNWTPEPRPA